MCVGVWGSPWSREAKALGGGGGKPETAVHTALNPNH